MYAEVLKMLLPPGKAFNDEASEVHSILRVAGNLLDRVYVRSKEIFNESPGRFRGLLEFWSSFLRVSSGSELERNKTILAWLSADGGQSEEYLLDVLKKQARNPGRIELRSDRGNHYCEVIGVDISTAQFRVGSPIGQVIRTWTREEELIAAFETIKHAEVEARYYG